MTDTTSAVREARPTWWELRRMIMDVAQSSAGKGYEYRSAEAEALATWIEQRFAAPTSTVDAGAVREALLEARMLRASIGRVGLDAVRNRAEAIIALLTTPPEAKAGEPCEAVAPTSRAVCELPRGHDGHHRAGLDGSFRWADQPGTDALREAAREMVNGTTALTPDRSCVRVPGSAFQALRAALDAGEERR